MTPQELKSSILQLAVQGRLVEQRPEEGTAEELYRQIQEEKQRLIKEGRIKKEKLALNLIVMLHPNLLKKMLIILLQHCLLVILMPK